MADLSLLQSFFELSLDGVVFSTPDGTILRANPAACRALARSEAELKSVGRQGILVDDARGRALLLRRQTDGSVRGEITALRSDGSTFPAEVSSGVMPGPEGTPLVFTIFRDASERHRLDATRQEAMTAAQNASAELDAILEALPGGVSFGTADGIHRCNAEALRQSGVESLEALRAHFGGRAEASDVRHEDGRPVAPGERPLARALAGERPTAHEWTRGADGKPRLLRSSAAPVVVGGRIVGAVALSLDITDQNELRLSVARSETMLRGITEAIRDPIFLKDRDGRWLFANAATLAAVGRSLEEVLGRTDREIHADPLIGAALIETDERIMASGRAETIEERIQAPDGYRVYLSSKAPLRDANGNVVGLVGSAQDITARKRAEDALHASEARLNEAQRNARIGSWRHVAGEPPQWSAEMYRLFELPRGRAPTDEEVLAAIHPEDREGAYQRAFGASIESGATDFSAQYRVVRADGQVRILSSMGSVHRHADGRVIDTVGTVQDVTGRHRAEAAAHAAAARQAFLADASKAFAAAGLDPREILDRLAALATESMADNCMVRLLSEDGVWLTLTAVASRDPEVTEALWTFEGATPERVDGPCLAGRLVHDPTPLLRPVITVEEARAGLPAERWDFFERFWARSALVVALVIRGRVLGVLSMVRYRPGLLPYTADDVALAQDLAERAALCVDSARQYAQAQHELTERRRAETERERLGLAIEHATEAVIVTDTAGDILYVNPAFEVMSGYSRAEALGRNPRFLRSGQQNVAFYRDLWQTISRGDTWRGRLVNLHKGGRAVTVEASVSPVRGPHGRVTSYVSVQRDITRELETAAELQQAQKMDSVGRFAGGVAHDFNNLLTVILSYTGFALDSTRESDPLREDLLAIDQAGRRAAALTRQLLAFSRKQVLEPARVDLNRLIQELDKMLRRLLREDIEVVHLQSVDPWSVLADPSQLEQIVMNLVVNARDAMPLGGRLTLATANVSLEHETDTAAPEGLQPGRYVAFSVTDTGVGMDAQTRARIFEPFFTTKGVGRGTGLGLSTVYGIARQSGGAVTVASEPGAGTTFTVLLPEAKSGEGAVPPESAPPPGLPASRHGGETILLVEDDPAVRGLTRRILDRAGYTVLAAANGAEALRLCERTGDAIDLVLTDAIMPIMGGRELVERLAQARPGLRVLFMSGYADGTLDELGTLPAGMGFIAKPLTERDLTRKVREALDD